MQSEGSQEVESSPDVVQLALAAELTDEPGTHFYYNNKAVNLLAGIVQKASGKKMDALLRSDVFGPLGITDFVWVRDSAGNPFSYARLEILPEDMAKLGQLALDRGRWQGKQLIAPEWFDAIMRVRLSSLALGFSGGPSRSTRRSSSTTNAFVRSPLPELTRPSSVEPPPREDVTNRERRTTPRSMLRSARSTGRQSAKRVLAPA